MKFAKCVAASMLAHVVLFAACYSLILLWKNSAFSVMDIDLTGSTLMLRPLNAAQKKKMPERSVNDWFTGRIVRPASVPERVTFTAAEESAAAACPPPCPDNAADWQDTGSMSRRPVWTQNQITEDDYPQDVRSQGKEGMVKVEVFIAADGSVKDVRVIQSNDSRFTELVVRKLKAAKFEPALDKTGQPAAVRMAIPIVFELR